jgi:hypothetical protein
VLSGGVVVEMVDFSYKLIEADDGMKEDEREKEDKEKRMKWGFE